METTIDAAGRVVIPKAMRARLGLADGGRVEVVEIDGAIRLSPANVPMELVEVDGVPVVRAGDEIPPLTDEAVREALERSRR